MVEDLGPGFDDGANGFLVALKVWNEHFNAAAGRLAADFLDDKREGASAAEIVIVAINAGDHCVLQTQFRYSLGDTARLVEVDRLGPALGHGAESAAARAEIAQHHECCGLVVPALADVGALRAFADGMQPERAGEALEVVYSASSATYTKGMTIPPNSPSSDGGMVTSSID